MSTNDVIKVSDVTPITRVVGCLKSYYDENIADDSYKEYTLYLVNTGSDVEGQGWSDLYYGDRKVTDIMVVDHYPDDAEYPDNKIYLQKLLPDDESWHLSGNSELNPAGFNMYYKYNGTLIPIFSDIIANVQYNTATDVVSLVWNLQDGTQAVTDLVTKDDIEEYLDEHMEEYLEQYVNENFVWKDVVDS